MKNTLRYEVNRWIDIRYDSIPKLLIPKILNYETYKDQVINEHIYSVQTLLEESQQDRHLIFDEEEKLFLQKILEYTTKEDTAYFRVIYS